MTKRRVRPASPPARNDETKGLHNLTRPVKIDFCPEFRPPEEKTVQGKDLLSVNDLSGEKIKALIHDAIDMKRDRWHSVLERKVLALVFEKPSLRTRVSFEVAMLQLGGRAIYLAPAEVGLGKRESVPDVANVLSRMVDVIAARTFSHQTVVELAANASVPVINALDDLEHPCQALADLLTIYEKKGDFKDLTVAYIGDGNNVANSLMLACCLVGINFRIASPRNYQVSPAMQALAAKHSDDNRCEILYTEDPATAAEGADVVYTDVWTSMGQEAESETRRKDFAAYQITPELLARAKEDVIFMHPLPAHRGEEVAAAVVDGPASVVFDQAENRLHAQKALLAEMLGGLDVYLRRHK
jgi:ornithine carbamoyltransferase